EQQRQLLEQARTEADTRQNVVNASRAVEVAKLDAEARVAKAEGDAKAKTINATADANVLSTVGSAEGAKVMSVGIAEADVLRKKVEAVGANAYAMMQIVS